MTPETNGAAPARRITVLYLLFQAADAVPDLVAALGRQRPPAGVDPERWAEVIFADDASTDGTVDRLRAELAAAELPFPARVVANEVNLGRSGSLNRALTAVETEYVLTCHLDCLFASDDYLARLVDLLDRHPDVGVVSGQPIADVDGGLSQVEKVYLASYLMDIFPEGTDELQPVGFGEGRCDGFRMAALREAGFYAANLRRAGEDHVLAAEIRAAGFRVCRAPGLRYYLSVSSSQDSFLKLVRHAHLFGRTHPYVILANRGTLAGVAGPQAGRNVTLRTTLRVLQLAGAGAWLGLAGATVSRRSRRRPAAAVVTTYLLRSALFLRYVRDLKFGARDVAALAALQPALDLAYAAGFVRGLCHVLEGGEPTIS
jgi:GT2 family glycosyltransferase